MAGISAFRSLLGLWVLIVTSIQPASAASHHSNTTTLASSASSFSSFSTASYTLYKNGSSNCPPCAINADEGLQQIVWYNSSISLTLDTVSVYVTTFRGLNATAVTKTSTIYGDIDKVNVSQVPEAQSIFLNHVAGQIEPYPGGGSAYLARGTEGSIGSVTSLAYPTAYVLISKIGWGTTLPYDGCPSGLQEANAPLTKTCGCGMTEFSDLAQEVSAGVTQTQIPLPTNFYYPLDIQSINYAALQGGMDQYVPFDLRALSSWLNQQPWAATLLPDLPRCVYPGLPSGPPGVKIPVIALTTTISTVVDGGLLPTHTFAKPASTHTPLGPTPTSNPYPTTKIKPSPTSSSYIVIKSTEAGSLNNNGMPLPGVGPMSVGSGGDESSVASPKHATEGSHSQPLKTNPELSKAAAVGPGGSQAIPTKVPGAEVWESTQAADGVNAPMSHPNIFGKPDLSATRGVALVSRTAVADLPNSLKPGNPPPSNARSQDMPKAIATVAGHAIDWSSGDKSLLVLHHIDSSLSTPVAAHVPTGNAEGMPVASGFDLDHSAAHESSNTLITVDQASAFPAMDADQTIKPSVAITVSGIVVSMGSTALVMGTSTIALPTPDASPQPVTSFLNGQTYTAYPTFKTKSSTTLTIPGALATISGTIVYPAPASVTHPVHLFTDSPEAAPSSRITFGGDIFTVGPSEVQVAGQTLHKGGPAISINGAQASLNTAGIVIGSSTLTYQAPVPTETTPPIFTVNGERVTAQSHAIVLGGQTISEGDTVTISATRVAYGTAGLIVGSSTQTPQAAGPYATSPFVFTMNGDTLTAESKNVLIEGQTVSEGGLAVTLSGIKVSLGTNDLLVGTRTLSFSQATDHASDGVAAAIMSAFGTPQSASPTGGSSSTGVSSSPPAAFTAGSGRMRIEDLLLIGPLLLIGSLALGIVL